MRRNAAAFGVPGLEVVEGTAPAALAGLTPPDAVFIGGGATIVLDAAVRALRAGGRLVVNAVTAETEALILQRQAMLGGELTRIAVARLEPVGRRQGWRPALPVTQWVWIKP
jgi:precorrin-6B C5,15-methyltransferase / cobalt-precorrin-6B C5,C15-methyltransferase